MVAFTRVWRRGAREGLLAWLKLLFLVNNWSNSGLGTSKLDTEQTQIMTPARGADLGLNARLHCLELIDGCFDVGCRYLIGLLGATIGRTRAGPRSYLADLVEVSRAHCRLTVDGDDLLVADLNSTNGTFVDDVRLNEPVLLPIGLLYRPLGRQSFLPARPRRAAGRSAERWTIMARLSRSPRAVNADSRPAPDIFLSYNREDQAKARRFAEAFTAEGFGVWWDVTLRTGEAYDEVTEAALRAAKAVVVLWSKRSVASRWVRAEATLGDRKGALVPAMIEPCERPVMFELTQTAELSHWDGAADDAAWRASSCRRAAVRRRMIY